MYDHGQVIKNPSLIGRVDFTGTCETSFFFFFFFTLPSTHFSYKLKTSTFFILSCKQTAGLPFSADIMLNETRVSDGGIYRCMVNNPPDTADPGVGELLLSVLGRWLTCCLFHLIKKKKLFIYLLSLL